jgi:hypothetical protein
MYAIAEPRIRASQALLDAGLLFLNDDVKVGAARRLMAGATYLDGIDLSIVKMLPSLLDEKNSKLLKKTMDDAKGLDLSALTNMPFVGLIVTDENVKNLAGALSASNAFYKDVSNSRLDLIAQQEAAAAALATDKELVSAVNALKTAEARDGLAAKIQADPSLADADKQSLLALVRAAPEILAAQTRLSPENVAYDAKLTSGIKDQKALHDKNKNNYEMAETILKLAAQNGGFKKTMAKIDTLQRDLQQLSPMIASLQTTIDSGAAGGLNFQELANKLVSMVDDLEASKDLIVMANELLSEENVDAARKIYGMVPQTEPGVNVLKEGAYRIATSLGENVNKESLLDQEGVKALATKMGGLADIVDNANSCVRALVDLSQSYVSFSGIGAGMEGHVKFVMRTEEITAQ